MDAKMMSATRSSVTFAELDFLAFDLRGFSV
jgi:hypothetical protein